jgi:transposase InsO family protein
MLRVLEVKASGYYRWRSRPPSQRAKENERLLEKIKAEHAASRSNYGSPKLYRKLRHDGETVNHKRVERLMKEHGITAKRVKQFTRTTTSRRSLPVTMGQTRRGRAVAPLVHSDRGSQYASAAFRERLAAWNCQQSMSGKGNCWDNAVAESFFGNLKREMVHHERFASRQAARDKLFDYIEVFYNRSRIHSASDYFAPGLAFLDQSPDSLLGYRQ